jgi:hypothetical protein
MADLQEGGREVATFTGGGRSCTDGRTERGEGGVENFGSKETSFEIFFGNGFFRKKLLVLVFIFLFLLVNALF